MIKHEQRLREANCDWGNPSWGGRLAETGEPMDKKRIEGRRDGRAGSTQQSPLVRVAEARTGTAGLNRRGSKQTVQSRQAQVCGVSTSGNHGASKSEAVTVCGRGVGLSCPFGQATGTAAYGPV